MSPAQRRWVIHAVSKAHDHEIVNQLRRQDDVAQPLTTPEPVLPEPALLEPVPDDPLLLDPPALVDTALPPLNVLPLGLVLGPFVGAELDAEELGVEGLTLVDGGAVAVGLAAVLGVAGALTQVAVPSAW
jgi:hypothetical protein